MAVCFRTICLKVLTTDSASFEQLGPECMGMEMLISQACCLKSFFLLILALCLL